MKINVILIFLFSYLVYASPILDGREAKGGGKGGGGKGGNNGGAIPPKSQNNPPPPVTSKGNPPPPASTKEQTPPTASSQAAAPTSSAKLSTSSIAASSTPEKSVSASSQIISVSSSLSSSASASASLSTSVLSTSSSILSTASASSSILSPISGSVSGSASSQSTDSRSGSSTHSLITSASASSTSSVSSISTTSTLTTSFSTSSVSSTSSSASSSSTGFICGIGCGSQSCRGKARPSKRATSSTTPLAKRTLEDVSVGARDAYVLKTILANVNTDTELNWNRLGVYAVSKQDVFGANPAIAWVGGIEGCTGIAVVSEKGYWVAHLMEEAFVDGNTDQWNKMIKALSDGDRRYEVPGDRQDLFGAGSNPKIYLMKPKDGRTNKPMYTKKLNDVMGKIQKGALSGVSVEEFTYKKPVDDAEKNRIDSTTSRGKLLIEYDNDQQVDGRTQNPQAAMARIWMEDQMHEQKWTARDDQKNGAQSTPSTTSTPTPTPTPSVPENRPNCISGSTKSLPKDDDSVITDAINSICSTSNINLSSANGVSNTFNGKTASGQDVAIQLSIKISTDQAGCPASTKKMLPRRFCRTKMLDALRSCPNADGSAFLGTKPFIWATNELGCVDFNIFAN